MRHNNEQGFTLVELLVVMVIIGILASLVAGNFVGTRLKARDARRKSDLTQVQSALEAYYNDHREYPSSNTQGEMTVDTVGVRWGEEQLWDEANGTVYMAILPADPSPNLSKYFYVADSTSQKYQIFTHLENVNDNIRGDLDEDCSSVSGVELLCNFGVSSSNTTVDATL